MLNTNEQVYATDHWGNEFWYQNSRLHRTDGPAIQYACGNHHWFQFGLRHNPNGPAIVTADGRKEWYIRDVEYTEDQFRMMAFINSRVAV